VYWQGQDKKTLKRINAMIEATAREPFTGIGKPEPLRGDLTGFWSKRIDDLQQTVVFIDNIY
jgi:toxin YoeB